MKRALTSVGFVVGLALAASPARAQTGGIRGKVVDEKGQPIIDAVVLLEHQGVARKAETRTNKKGAYLQLGLLRGAYRLTASKEGYQPRFVEATVDVGETTDVREIQLLAAKTAAPVAEPTGPSEDELREKFAEALAAARAGRLGEAEALFLEFLEVQPDVAEVHRNLGYVYARKKDWPRAEASYLRTLELRPGEPGVTIALAQVYRESGQDAKAIAAFEAVLAADPSRAEAHFHLGTLLMKQGKRPEAAGHLQAYLSSNPQDARYVETAKGLLATLEK
jgi:tetratricopeptide (TPR) repeat protein